MSYNTKRWFYYLRIRPGDLLSCPLSGIVMGLVFVIFFSPVPQAFELEEVTIAQLQEGMKTGKYTARSIVEMYLKRIEEIDQNGPRLRSVIEVNPDALAIADQLDQERREGKVRGPLHGIPILLKDNIETADKLHTTAGSYALVDIPVKQDSYVAQKLREAGAIILGKANMSEWAYFRSTRASSGWSARGGQTKNPYILTRNPCGSSSGSGAAVAANLVAAAIGTETDGSIVCPASANSIVGIKPTMGLVGRSGVIPGAHSQDVVGPMTRTVADAAIVLGALTGVDPRDPVTEASKGKSYTDYTQFLDPNGLKGARIGVARNYFGYHEKVDALINQSLEVMKKQGAIIVDPANIETAGKFGGCEVTIFLYELKADLAKYLQERSSTGPQTLKDLIDFNERNKDKEMPYFEQEFFKLAEEKGGPLTDPAYQEAVKECHRLAADEGLDATLKKYNVDVIVAPTLGPVMPIDLVLGDHLIPPWATLHWAPSVAAVAGYPHISVPAGYIFGVPVGISFMGGAWSEPTLIKIAYAFEQATKYRKPPQFLPNDPTH
ncbi:MAG TPA: amidase [Candidatus Limnocylindrales bacterium]|nr:amidase [Candidatus Limnocylindrales bacterium]